MIKRTISIVIILFLIILSQAMANPTDPEIAHLLQYVRESNVIFIRNGKEYQPVEAVRHLVNKLDYFKDKIATAEDFISLCATKSLISGDLYLIKTKSGELQETSKWLMDELARYRTR
jgi:hypothetical protein